MNDMEELCSLLRDIKSELQEINYKLDKLEKLDKLDTLSRVTEDLSKIKDETKNIKILKMLD